MEGRRALEKADFLNRYDFGARTIHPFVLGNGINPFAVRSAISELEPGALMGTSVLLITGKGNTVATTTITPEQLPEGVNVKGAVLICPGEAYQYRSDQPVSVDVAEAL